ncbi:18556_t:CDS:2 [Entrophospora sp. SA101]|nr:13105_t:CDS:2 [Entrophospora sp. SA101]CAJ0631324.1 13600_t:CDS:2 [Entrophospora sp. SA101]CAJ0751071.1 18556_t:CDS:2 [Entrophospora sp. SA101]CAJ0828390.1 11135_t:CDS:2 [Entrophospora sp. SA101]CAJ0874748.1 3504_t:CDS:2 [Entrophospora sp. SA101]
MGRIRRSRTHKNIRDHYRKYRTRNYTKDLDQIHEDLKKLTDEKMMRIEEKIESGSGGSGKGEIINQENNFLLSIKINEINNNSNNSVDDTNIEDLELPGSGKFYCIHCAIKLLKETPYSQKEAEAAVGYSTENSRNKSLLNDIIIT